MTAIQLLEKLGSDAAFQGQKQLVANVIGDALEENHKQWCIMFPEKEGDDTDEGEQKDKEDKSEIARH